MDEIGFRRFLLVCVFASVLQSKSEAQSLDSSSNLLSHFGTLLPSQSFHYFSTNSSATLQTQTPSPSLSSSFISSDTTRNTSMYFTSSSFFTPNSVYQEPSSSSSVARLASSYVPPTTSSSAPTDKQLASSSVLPTTSSSAPTDKQEDTDDEKRRITQYLLYACLGIFLVILLILISVAVQVSRLSKTLKEKITANTGR